MDFVVVRYDYWFYANEKAISGLYFFYIFPVFISFFMRQNINKPSDFLSWIYFFLVLLPSIALSPFVSSDLYTGFFANSLVLVVNVFLILLGLINENKIIIVVSLPLGDRLPLNLKSKFNLLLNNWF